MMCYGGKCEREKSPLTPGFSHFFAWVTKTRREIFGIMDNTYGAYTDFYEISMLDALIREGKHMTPAVFQMFTRKLPQGRGYGVYAGLGRFLHAVQRFTFTQEDLSLFSSLNVSEETLTYLRNFTFTGTIKSYFEGDLYFPHSPVMQVEAPLGEGLLLETLALSIVNHDSAVASAASRMRTAAGGRTLIEMGGRRTHEHAAVASARAAYIAGFDATSNIQAGVEYGIPVRGTAAHAFTLAHETEEEAFRTQVKHHGTGTTLLVDTYDIREGVTTAIRVGGVSLGGVRIDSGDLHVESVKVRGMLDAAGNVDTKIVATSDLDEFTIAQLSDAPIDVYGVGTQLVTGSGHPTAHFVYKLVEVGNPGRVVEKKSTSKESVGGRKVPHRTYTSDGFIVGEFYHTMTAANNDYMLPVECGTSLYETFYQNGVLVNFDTIEGFTRQGKMYHESVKQTLPIELLNLNVGGNFIAQQHSKQV